MSVGTDHDTSAFAVQTIRRWWFRMGGERYPQAWQLLIAPDGGGINGHRVRLWKLELSRLVQETGLDIEVHHFPPGTSKWNKIEHRLFSFITMNGSGHPLISHEVIASLIAGTKTRSSLAVRAELDSAEYLKGQIVSDEAFAAVKIERNEFHGDLSFIVTGANRHDVTQLDAVLSTTAVKRQMPSGRRFASICAWSQPIVQTGIADMGTFVIPMAVAWLAWLELKVR